MLDNQQGCLVDALAGMEGALPMAPEMVQAIAAPRDDVTHHGTLKIIGSLPSVDRGYPATLDPDPDTMSEPIIDKALLELDNQPRGPNDDRRGNNGFAFRIRNGIGRFDGPVWNIIKWIKVTGSGTTAGGKDYIDGVVVGDMWGNDETTTPQRVFVPDTFPVTPANDSIIPYFQDSTGSGMLPMAPTGDSNIATVTVVTAITISSTTISITTRDLTVLKATAGADSTIHTFTTECP